MRACIITTRTASLQTQWHEERGVKKETARQLLARSLNTPYRSLAADESPLAHHWGRSIRIKQTATAESAKTLTGLVTVNNANKIATRLVYDTLRVELVWANMIEGAPILIGVADPDLSLLSAPASALVAGRSSILHL